MNTKIGPLQIAIILLTIATAAIHLSISIPDPGQNLLLLLNGVGYLVLLIALFLPQLSRYHGLIRWGLILYTSATIIAWIVIGSRNTIGYTDKLIEVVLIVLLFIDMRRS